MTAPSVTTTSTLPYQFASACGPDHFVTRWTAYASSRTDASHAYHEAAALALLASATPRLRARLREYPKGLATNLYVLQLGDSTSSRKSTSQNFARDVQGRALPESLSADHFSPEGFVEQLAARPHNSTTLYVDEFGELLDKLHHAKHMAMMRGLLMTVYGGDDYRYTRHSKRTGHGTKVADADAVKEPHLTIVGACTPAIFDCLNAADVTSGLLPRFAIIMPTTKPARRPFGELVDAIEQHGNDLVTWLHTLHLWATSDPTPPVVFAPQALAALDQFAATLETAASHQPDLVKTMLQRLPAMAIKVAMLCAAGRPSAFTESTLTITLADAASAIAIATRWQQDAERFADRIGESTFERTVQRCLRLVQKRLIVQRSVVARHVKVERKLLDHVRDTLMDRGHLTVAAQKAKSGPPAEMWTLATPTSVEEP